MRKDDFEVHLTEQTTAMIKMMRESDNHYYEKGKKGLKRSNSKLNSQVSVKKGEAPMKRYTVPADSDYRAEDDSKLKAFLEQKCTERARSRLYKTSVSCPSPGDKSKNSDVDDVTVVRDSVSGHVPAHLAAENSLGSASPVPHS